MYNALFCACLLHIGTCGKLFAHIYSVSDNGLFPIEQPYIDAQQACLILGITYAQFRYLRLQNKITTYKATAKQRREMKLNARGQVFSRDEVLSLRDLMDKPEVVTR